MSKELLARTKKFCLKAIELAHLLPNTYLGNHIKGQLIRAGSSVAANHRAARLAQSSASFVAKISIVIEESDECEFWCEIIEEQNLVKNPLLAVVHNEAKEISSIFIATRKTMNSKKR